MGCAAVLPTFRGPLRDLAILSAFLLLLAGCGSEQAELLPAPDHIWPPRLDEPYPDLNLLDASGNRVSLSSFKGNVILLEPIGMTCPACNAFSGANRGEIGHFEGIVPQRGLKSIEELMPEYSWGTETSDDRLVFVQLLLYDLKMKAPLVEDARNWAEHFKLNECDNCVVLVGKDYLIGDASYNMIPGFQLVDKDFFLRYDSTGHRPTHDLWTELLPALPGLLRE